MRLCSIYLQLLYITIILDSAHTCFRYCDDSDGSILMTFETATYRVIKPSFQDLIGNTSNNDKNNKSEELEKIKANEMKNMKSTFLLVPTGEEVTISDFRTSYKGMLKCEEEIPIEILSQPITSKQPAKQNGKKNSTTIKKGKLKSNEELSMNIPAVIASNTMVSTSNIFSPNTVAILLTDFDIKNRARGYSLFLPDNKMKFEEYWKIGYGAILQSEKNWDFNCDENSHFKDRKHTGKLQIL